MWMLRRIRVRGAAWALAGLTALAAGGALAQEDQADSEKLTIELNKLEDVEGACHASFVVRNGLASALDRLTLDLYLFDVNGIIAQHTVLDMGPIPKNKTRILTFSVINDKCENIARIVINDMPNCQLSGGQAIDCLAVSRVWSLNRVEFTP